MSTKTGFSYEVFMKNDFPKFDFVFIDGGHDYETVRHDFFASINLVSEKFVILFDDYISRPFYGVQKFVDEEITPHFKSIIIETGFLKINETESKKHSRCLIESESLETPISEIFPNQKIQMILKNYRQHQKRVKKYRKIINRLPFLRNKKIKFWEN